MGLDELIDTYKLELLTIERRIPQASGSDLIMLKDLKQQYIAKISELTIQQEVSKYGTRPKFAYPTVITIPATT